MKHSLPYVRSVRTLTRLSSATLAGTALLLAACGDREDRDLTSNEAATDQTERVAATSPTSTSDQRMASQSSGDQQRQERAQNGQQSEGLEQRIRTDLRMAQDISLSDQQIDGIDIRVQENTVVLSGTVPNEQSAQRIEQRVSDIQGVQSVDNQLRPQDQSAVAE